MNEVLNEKNRVAYLDYFNIKKSKFLFQRILSSALLVFIVLAIGLAGNKPFFLFLTPIAFFLGYKMPYMNLLSMKRHADTLKQYSFPTFLRYFLILSETQGNVINTLKATLIYLDRPTEIEVTKIIKSLEEGENRRKAFMDFADYIGTIEANMVMDMIYNFDQDGIDKDSLHELEELVEKLQENKTNEFITKSVNSMESHANPYIFSSMGFMFGFIGIVIMSYLSLVTQNLSG